MSEQEFMEKYGRTAVYFSRLYKYRVIYLNAEVGIKVSGVIESRDDLHAQETVQDIFDLEYFQFELLKK